MCVWYISGWMANFSWYAIGSRGIYILYRHIFLLASRIPMNFLPLLAFTTIRLVARFIKAAE